MYGRSRESEADCFWREMGKVQGKGGTLKPLPRWNKARPGRLREQLQALFDCPAWWWEWVVSKPSAWNVHS